MDEAEEEGEQEEVACGSRGLDAARVVAAFVGAFAGVLGCPLRSTQLEPQASFFPEFYGECRAAGTVVSKRLNRVLACR